MVRARRQDAWRRALAVRTLAGIVLAVGVCALMLAAQGLNDRVFPADAAVVPCGGASGDGSLLPRLRWRADTAYGLYYYGTVKKILISGGTGSSGLNAAEAVRDYLLEHGVRPADIIVDRAGSSTEATARFAASYAKEHGWQRVVAVSQFFHLPRLMLSLRHEGVPIVGSLAAGNFEFSDFIALLLEIPAYFAYWSEIK